MSGACGHNRLVLAITATWVAACGAAHGDRQVDAASEASGRDARDAAIADAGEPLAPPPARELTEEEAAWLGEPDFEIGLKQTGGQFVSPNYEATVRSNGSVRFTGHQYVWKPGTYELPVSTETAAELFRNLLLRGFLDLQASYETEENGCDQNHHSHDVIFTLRAGSREKIVDFYQGCTRELAEFARMRAMRREIVELANIARLIETARRDCTGFRPWTRIGPRHVIHDGNDQAVGLLRFGNGGYTDRSWTASSCDGEEIGRGDVQGTWDCGPRLLPTMELTFGWPGREQPQSAATIEPTFGASQEERESRLEVRLFTFEGETAQYIVPGEACH
jgi:hypothetical protein